MWQDHIRHEGGVSAAVQLSVWTTRHTAAGTYYVRH